MGSFVGLKEDVNRCESRMAFGRRSTAFGQLLSGRRREAPGESRVLKLQRAKECDVTVLSYVFGKKASRQRRETTSYQEVSAEIWARLQATHNLTPEHKSSDMLEPMVARSGC